MDGEPDEHVRAKVPALTWTLLSAALSFVAALVGGVLPLVTGLYDGADTPPRPFPSAALDFQSSQPPQSAPRPLSLVNLEPVRTNTSFFSAGLGHVNGEILDHSLLVQISDSTNFADLEYNLGRNYDTFEAVLGVDDPSKVAERVLIQLALDGHIVFRTLISVGESSVVSLDVTGALRLAFNITAPVSECCATVVIGNAELH